MYFQLDTGERIGDKLVRDLVSYLIFKIEKLPDL
jgi:hypothetical protein